MKIKKIIAFLLITALALVITGCAGDLAEPVVPEDTLTEQTESSESNEPKDTPHRIGTKGITSGDWDWHYTSLEEVAEEVDLIVELTITEWLGEGLSRDDAATYYSAEINQTLKGEERDTIVVRQIGNSEYTCEFDPLFKIGDRLFLFLREMNYEKLWEEYEWKPEVEYENAYAIYGNILTTLMVWEDEIKDETFILSRYDWGMAYDIVRNKEIKSINSKTRNAIAEDYLEYDPIFEEFEHSLGHAFIYDDVVERVLETSQEVEEQ